MFKTEFFAQVFRHPKAIGAIAPSGRNLSRRIAALADWDSIENVLEYGPGTGPLTEQIVDRLRPGMRFVAIEINERFANLLRERFPQITVRNDSVANVKTVCEEEGIEGVDAILSGLPWAAFSDREQNTYLDATKSVLRPNAQFITFAYLQGLVLPSATRFRRKLKRYFSSVQMSQPVWANFPPAVVYHCRNRSATQ
jgi:phospholipid N-methyltransferase